MAIELYWYLQQTAFQLEKKADELLRLQLAIGVAQYKVLAAVGRNSLAKQNVVADLLHQTEASISRQVHILERKKMLHVGLVIGNKRARELVLTESGERVLHEAEQIIVSAVDQILQSVPSSERVKLESILNRLYP
jgi:DNA-binding MarR family transcriptional regulator